MSVEKWTDILLLVVMAGAAVGIIGSLVVNVLDFFSGDDDAPIEPLQCRFKYDDPAYQCSGPAEVQFLVITGQGQWGVRFNTCINHSVDGVKATEERNHKLAAIDPSEWPRRLPPKHLTEAPPNT